MELREQLAAILADVKNWEEFKKQYRFSAATHLEIADRIVAVLAKEGYGKMVDKRTDVNCAWCKREPTCPGLHDCSKTTILSVFEPIK